MYNTRKKKLIPRYDHHNYEKKTHGKTTIYSNQTDQKAYLHAKSYHPKCTKENISYSQALRIKRICSDESDYQYNSEKLLSELVERGYKTDTLKKNIEKANNVKREDLLNYKAKTPHTKIPLIVTYNKNLPKMKQMVDNMEYIEDQS